MAVQMWVKGSGIKVGDQFKSPATWAWSMVTETQVVIRSLFGKRPRRSVRVWLADGSEFDVAYRDTYLVQRS
jgi:hypothetical protein